MLSGQLNKQPFNFETYKLGSSHKSTSGNKNQGSRRKYTMDPQLTNPVYTHLRRERMNRHVFEFMLRQNKEQPPRSFNKLKQYSPNFNAFQKNTRSIPSRQLQRFRSQGQNIIQNACKISIQVKNNKRRMSILNKYNDLIGKYCEVVPKLKTQKQKELFLAHQQIQKICKEQYAFKEKVIKRKKSQFRQFEQPKINFKMLKKNKRMVTQVSQTVHLDEQILKRTNTYTF